MYQNDRVLILGIETSCDDTGVALYDSERRELVAHAVHTQAAMHQAYGGVVPELASRDHVRRLVPLTKKVLGERDLADIDGIGYTEGPGLAGSARTSSCAPRSMRKRSGAGSTCSIRSRSCVPITGP